ncbi:MAG: single-stranded DNA-binding protein [Candidatus Colwellbacteria bacterium]|nr:single-stranded DNA-binding protein [Candidatus Colwellbacteria bacterium]
MNVNKVILVGRLTADPQVRTTTSGERVVTIGVATNRTWTDKGGARRDATEFHNVVVWGRQADVVSQFLSKGSLVFIEGRLQTRTWQGKDGTQRRTTEVIAEHVQLGPRGAANAPSAGQGGTPSEPFDRSSAQGAPVAEDVPVIDLDADASEIKPEDLPF